MGVCRGVNSDAAGMLFALAERLVMPLAAAAVIAMYTVSLTNNDDRKKSGVRQRTVFPHSQNRIRQSRRARGMVKPRAAEDVELMRLIKLNGFRVRGFIRGKSLRRRTCTTLRCGRCLSAGAGFMPAEAADGRGEFLPQ